MAKVVPIVGRTASWLDQTSVRSFRLTIVLGYGDLCESREHIKHGYTFADLEQCGYMRSNLRNEFFNCFIA